MARFLLDANPSPTVGRFLAHALNLDVASLQDQHLGQLPDREVIRLARVTGQVVVTLDRDFAEYSPHPAARWAWRRLSTPAASTRCRSSWAPATQQLSTQQLSADCTTCN